MINEVKLERSERNIEVKYNIKYSHVISKFSDSVNFALTDGMTSSASRLIGADGTHSTVHKYIYPAVTPRYLGLLGVTSVIPFSSIRLPEKDYPLTVVTFMKPGTLMNFPKKSMALKSSSRSHSHIPSNRVKAGIRDTLHTDTDKVVRLFQKNIHVRPDIVQSALQYLNGDTLNTWPYYAALRLEQWASDGIGDSLAVNNGSIYVFVCS